MLVIGSTAMKYFFKDFHREPKDFDVFSRVPVPGAEVFWDERLADKANPWWWRANDPDMWYAGPSELYTLKLSHAAWDLGGESWEKHMHDAMFLKAKGFGVYEDMYKLLYQIWEDKHGKKKVNLQKESDDFFSDAVRRTYDHDSIHYSVAYGDNPLYESYFKTGASVEMDMGQIKTAPFESQVALFREEIYATALERWIIPNDYRFSPMRAYALALKKTIVSLTKGWSSRFIAEHYDIFKSPDMNYVQHHLSKKHLLIRLEQA